MRKFQRVKAPEFLEEKWEQWGKDWEQRHQANSGAAFDWHTLEGERVNHKLLPILKGQVQDHCSFCDNFPISPPSNDTIDHFRPKTRFAKEAYKWENLYYSCDFCQGRGADFDEVLLAGDRDNFDFDKYFRWDYTFGTLEINENASVEDQKRAEATVRLFRLNTRHPLLRRRELHRRSKMPDEPLDEFAYRDFVGGPGV